MTTRDKTAVVTLRIMVPTFSPLVAAEEYLPKLMEAALKADVPKAGSVGLRLKGATVSA